MRLRSRRRNLIVLSTRYNPYISRPARIAKRRRFRLARTAGLLMVVGVLRLAGAMRSCWRLSIGLSGILLEAIGITLLSGPAQSAVDLLGLAVLLFALLRNEGSASRTTLPQVTWRRSC